MLKIIRFTVVETSRNAADLDHLVSKISVEDYSTSRVDGNLDCTIKNVDPDDWLLLLHDMCEYRMEPTIVAFI